MTGAYFLNPLDNDQFALFEAVCHHHVSALIDSGRHASQLNLFRAVDHQDIAARLVELDSGLRHHSEIAGQNAGVAFLPVDVVNDPSVIGHNRKLVSINSAMSLDLYGQVVADSIDGKQISGVGGHEDFVAGADLRLDAHSLICLRSTVTVGGVVRSRILPLLPEGAVVSTPRHHTGTVVTEYGAAELTGLTVRERASALAGVAHPDFRAQLHEAAGTLGRR